MKNKVIRKILAVVLSAALTLGSSVVLAQSPDSKNNISDSEKATNKLLNAGWSMKQINDLPKEELLTYKDGEIVSVNTKYYRITSEKKEVEVFDEKTKTNKKVKEPIPETRKSTELTKEQCLTEVEAYKKNHSQENTDELSKMSSSNGTLGLQSMGSYDDGYNFQADADGWIQMDITATHQSGTLYKLSAGWTWLIDPQYTLEDVIGLGHDGGLTQTNDAVYSYYQYDYKYFNGSYTSVTSTTTVTAPKQSTVDSGGTVLSYDLKDSESSGYNGVYGWYGNHRGYMTYNVNVNNSSLQYVSVYGKYAHQQTVFSISPGISWPLSVGFSVSQSSKFDQISPNPYMSIHVNY